MPRQFGITNVAPWAAAPTGVNAGDTYYNTTSKTLWAYDPTTAAWYAVSTRITNGWWVTPFGAAATSPNATQIQIGGVDLRSYVSVGTPMRWFQTAIGYSYGYISVISYTAPNTLLTLVTPNAAAIQNNTITEWGICPNGNPSDFPASFAWTPTITGFSTLPTGIADFFTVNDGWCCYTARWLTAGVSNATTMTISNAPMRALNVANAQWISACACDDNGAVVLTPSAMRIQANGVVISVFKDWDFGSNKWTASGNKRLNTGTLWYPVR